MICIVEDDPQVATLVARVAGHTGRPVMVFNSPAEVLNLQHIQQIELVIADVNMPDFTGPEVVAQLRTKGLTCPLLFISGDSTFETVENALNIAGACFLPKPFTVTELQEAISNALGQR